MQKVSAPKAREKVEHNRQHDGNNNARNERKRDEPIAAPHRQVARQLAQRKSGVRDERDDEANEKQQSTSGHQDFSQRRCHFEYSKLSAGAHRIQAQNRLAMPIGGAA